MQLNVDYNTLQCVDFGFHNSIARAFMTHMSCEECQKKTLLESIESMNECIGNLDARTDKQRFLEAYNSAYMLPNKFSFKAHKDDEVCSIVAASAVESG